MNLIKHQRLDIDKIYLYVKDSLKSKYQLVINGRERVEIENSKNPKVFIDYSRKIDGVYKNLEDYSATKKSSVNSFWWYNSRCGILWKSKSYSHSIVLRGGKLNISLVFISQSYFKVPKTIRLNTTHYFIMKIPNKRKLQKIVSNHSSDIDFKESMKLYKEYTKEPYSFLVKDTTLSSDSPLLFRKKLL